MSYPLDNLGDYNIARTDLKKFGGDIEKLYNHIGKTAVEKKRPYIMLEGGLIVLGVIGVTKLCKLGYESYQKRKALIKKESALKKEFVHKMQVINEDCSEGATSEVKKQDQESMGTLKEVKNNADVSILR
ncbi:MAG: hypothetical protein U0M42_08405 [Acutalibacteraceae bacterium]|nr:hypothetical protein [Acutalibacteraceae bacterium]